jgi:hypothetical protein
LKAESVLADERTASIRPSYTSELAAPRKGTKYTRELLTDWYTGFPAAHALHVKPNVVTNLYPPKKKFPLFAKALDSTDTKKPTVGTMAPPTVMVTAAKKGAPRKLPGLPTATHSTLPDATATVVLAHWG